MGRVQMHPTCSILLGLKVDEPPMLQESVELTNGSHVNCSHTREVSPSTVLSVWQICMCHGCCSAPHALTHLSAEHSRRHL